MSNMLVLASTLWQWGGSTVVHDCAVGSFNVRLDGNVYNSAFCTVIDRVGASAIVYATEITRVGAAVYNLELACAVAIQVACADRM